MKSELEAMTQGIRGGKNTYKRVGACSIMANDNGQRHELEINADSFTGYGNTYQQREQTLINIESNGIMIFTGTIEKLVDQLKK
jgi:hypothetical protein